MSRVLQGLLAAFLSAAAGAAAAEDAPATPDPQSVAVNIERTPVQSWPGYGIYLGNGLVITAAHVVAPVAQSQPKVVVTGQHLPTTLVKEGNFPAQDLTVLKIDGAVPSDLASRHTTICADPPHAGEAVVVATPEKVAPSAIVQPEMLPPSYRDNATAWIKDVYSTGNSGSGVFDAGSRCLLGIMSSKLETHVRLIVNGEHVVRTVAVAKHFVPAADIRGFLSGLPSP